VGRLSPRVPPLVAESAAACPAWAAGLGDLPVGCAGWVPACGVFGAWLRLRVAVRGLGRMPLWSPPSPVPRWPLSQSPLGVGALSLVVPQAQPTVRDTVLLRPHTATGKMTWSSSNLKDSLASESTGSHLLFRVDRKGAVDRFPTLNTVSASAAPAESEEIMW
jgi:hypothetical protein